ncbi:MAG TPA: cytochrome ubiquinol oxidase subunit I [Candidatus Dormibacteraeota bacterium]|jgi:cytochrome d ubiquinol oxidase subunit I|nr:cytochrome ubiquinol oxidase subunit I [Candidatus Dormibacteraeota bacterium]
MHLFLDVPLPAHSPDMGGLMGYRIAIGTIFTFHILLAGAVSGASQLGPFLEWLGWMRRRQSYERVARGLGRFLVYYFAFGSAAAILAISALLVGLWGHAWAEINRILWWPFYIEAWSFVMMVIGVYVWHYTWDALRRWKVLHMCIGGLLVIFSIVQVAMIDIVASYMLTPTPPKQPIGVWLNPTWYPLQIHTIIANLAYIAYLIGAFSAIRFLRAKTDEERSLYDWAGSLGIIWGTALTLLQPVVGYSYAKEIQLQAYGAWYKMMEGNLSLEFLAQITLLGLMLFAAALYFWMRLRRARARGRSLLGMLSVLLLLTTIFAALPYQFAFTLDQVQAAGLNRPFWEGGLINPFAAMIPYKILALTAYTVFGIAIIYIYLRGFRDVRWGQAGRGEQRALIFLGVAVMAMISLMGFIRENARFPDVIAGHVQEFHQKDVNQPNVQPAGSAGDSTRSATPAISIDPVRPSPSPGQETRPSRSP